jgi:uncharacterized repeat protein (TIGR03803 family)
MRIRLLLLSLLTLPALPSQGQYNFKILHAFGSGNDGGGLYDSVTFDVQGNLYGTTAGGGAYNDGTVFQLKPASKGTWKESILHSFPSRPNDGMAPLGGVMLGPEGRFYGTTQVGGAYSAGTVFELALLPHGWKETPLYSFTHDDQACCPWGNLVTDSVGNLYGTGDAAFEISPRTKGWTEKILHVFNGKNGDGVALYAGPIRDADGNLYGTTDMGGGSKDCDDGCGTVWELSPPAPGSPTQGWTEHILHRFGVGDDLAFPGSGQLAMDPQGNLYGGVLGGKYRAAVIYKLSPVSTTSSTGKAWQLTVLYNFTGGPDGDFPAGVILDKAGSLYGVCGAGGAYGEGTVFKLSPQSDGTWKFTLLHTFTGHDGFNAVANPTLGPDGKLYGTAESGGPHGGGVVFQLTP